jgi:hypothetical protein
VKKKPPTHPTADLFPMLDGDELAVLTADIKANGLRQSIVLDGEGRILDGRNRLAACERAGIKPTFTTYNGDDTDLFILSANVNRRHMSTGARAMATAMVLATIGKRRPGRWARGSVPVTSGSGSNGWPQRMAEAGLVVDAGDHGLCVRVITGELALDAAIVAVKTTAGDTPEATAARRRHDSEELVAATVETEPAVEELDDMVGAVAEQTKAAVEVDEVEQDDPVSEETADEPDEPEPEKRPDGRKTVEGRPARPFQAETQRGRGNEGLREIRPLLRAIEALDAELHNGQLRKLTGVPRRRLAEELTSFAVTIHWACDVLAGAETA